MKKFPWKLILVCVGWLLLVAGIVPGAYVVVGLGNAHNQKPLSVPVPLTEGTFTSPFFMPNRSGDYRIDLAWDLIPARQTSVDLDWKVVAENGSLIQQGTFLNMLRGANTISLGTYTPIAGQREQVVLNVHADVDQGGAHAKLEAGPPDPSPGLSESIPFAAGWALFVAVPGAILLLVLAIVGAKERKKDSAVIRGRATKV